MIPSADHLVSAGTGTCSFLADVTYNGNLSEELEETRNEFSFLFIIVPFFFGMDTTVIPHFNQW